MFRFQDNVPEIYVDESRDFQLLCRLADAVYGGVKYEIDSLCHTANTKEINNKLLPLLKSKVGFFSDDDLTEEQLRYLLQGFPEIVRNKGSKKAIEEALYMWFRLHKVNAKIVLLDIDNESKEIKLNVAMMPKDTGIMDEIFKYILPTGYIVNYQFGIPIDDSVNLTYIDNLNGVLIHNYYNSAIRIQDKYNQDTYNGTEMQVALAERLVGTVGLTEVASISDYNKPNDKFEYQVININKNTDTLTDISAKQKEKS